MMIIVVLLSRKQNEKKYIKTERQHSEMEKKIIEYLSIDPKAPQGFI